MPAPDLHPLPGNEVLVAGVAGEPLRLHVAEHGRESGRLPLLMIAEPPATSYLWRDVARDLEREWRSFMPDLVGTGASERPPVRRAYAIDAQANALTGLLDALHLPRVAVIASGLAGRSLSNWPPGCPNGSRHSLSSARSCTATPGRPPVCSRCCRSVQARRSSPRCAEAVIAAGAG